MPADLNSDGVVDSFDLSILLSQWGTDDTADLNGDNTVDALDLSILLSEWGPVDSRTAASITEDTNSYIANPGIGWSSGPGGAPDNAIPITVDYIRLNWKDINTGLNTYDWTIIDNGINGAVTAGRQFAFRIRAMRGESFGGHQVPQWVLDGFSDGGTSYAGAVITNVGDPLYTDKTYLYAWEKFIKAMVLRYDGNPDIAWIENGGYGDFGEWSYLDHQTTWEGVSVDDFYPTSTPDGDARVRLIALFMGGAGQGAVTRSDGGNQEVVYSYNGFQQTQVLQPYAGQRQVIRYALDTYSNAGIRFDGFGTAVAGDFEYWVGARNMAHFQNAPFLGEVGGTNTPYDATRTTFMQNVLEVAQEGHASFHNDNYNQFDTTAVTDLVKFMGYRFIPTSIEWNSQATTGGSLDLQATFLNRGMAPAYVRTGQDFVFKAGLRNQAGEVIKEWILAANPNAWMPAEPFPGTPPDNVVDESLQLAGEVPAGTYTVVVGVYCQRTAQFIALAISEPEQSSDDWYDLGPINVV